MANVERPILKYTLIIATIIGILVFGYKTLFPKQYTEIEFGMSQEDLIKLKGEPDEVINSQNGDRITLFYNNKIYFGYPCAEHYNFGNRGILTGDELELDGYGYEFEVKDIETAEKMFWDIRKQMMDKYGHDMEKQNSFLGHSVYMDTTDNDGFDFRESYENGQGAYTSWITDGHTKFVSIDKKYGLTVFFTDHK